MQKGMYLTTPLLIKQVLNKVLFLQVLTLNCMYPLLQKQKEGVCVCVGDGGGRSGFCLFHSQWVQLRFS